jgi:hypothetical protein
MTKPTKPLARGAKQAKSASGANQAEPTVRTPQAGSSGAAKAAASAKARQAASAKTSAKKGPPNRTQSKKIVNQRQTPWGLIIAVTLVVLLAVGVVGYAVAKTNSKNNAADPSKIVGIQHYANLTRNHVTTVMSYPQSPPVGGDHSPVWADCTGTVYPNQIANENAVHTLEHGAVWITYKPGLAADQLDVLTKLVSGKPYMLLTPYAGLKSNVSLQAWGYQLFVDSASDPRVQQFVKALRLNQKNTPELGASCDNPTFKSNPSTPGKPTES